MVIPAIDEPGLWLDPEWREGMPGVYALIVGVSEYTHLTDGKRPAPETYDLGQLAVSARTAAAIFRWLNTQFVRDGLPLVWCRLLLSPTADERETLSAWNIHHYERPTYRALVEAIDQWSVSIPRGGAAAGASRSLFFFSGHGLQANWTPLLLPSDYLKPPFSAPRLQHCISVKEMQQWMETHPAREHLALIDACRNEFSPLANKGATANTLFEVVPTAGPVPAAVATFSAAAPKETAYQHPAQDYTFFGRALLESLEGAAEPAMLARDGEMMVEFLRLVRHVKPRVNALLREVGAQVEQTAFPTLRPVDAEFILTELAPPLAWPAQEALQDAAQEAPQDAARPRSFMDSSRDAQQIVDDHFKVIDARPAPIAELRDFPSAHRRFGHEYASEQWAVDGFHVHDLRDGSLIADDRNVVIVTRTERDEESLMVRVDLELRAQWEAPEGLLLVFDRPGEVAAGRLAIPVPTDPGCVVPLRLTLTLAPPPSRGRPRLQRVEARLGPSDSNVHYQYLWELLKVVRFGSFADAARAADPKRLKAAVGDKWEAPTAAIAGAITLARGGQLAQVGDWTRNLMNHFPHPDGAVLWAESLRVALDAGDPTPFGELDPLGAIAEAMLTLETRGVPFFNESCSLAAELLAYLRRRKSELGRPMQERLMHVRRMFRRIFQISRPSGQLLMVAAASAKGRSLAVEAAPLSSAEIYAALRPRA